MLRFLSMLSGSALICLGVYFSYAFYQYKNDQEHGDAYCLRVEHDAVGTVSSFADTLRYSFRKDPGAKGTLLDMESIDQPDAITNPLGGILSDNALTCLHSNTILDRGQEEIAKARDEKCSENIVADLQRRIDTATYRLNGAGCVRQKKEDAPSTP